MQPITRRQFLRGAVGGDGTLAAASAASPAADLVRFAWWNDVGGPTPFQISVTGPGDAALLPLLYDTRTWKDEHGIIPWLVSAWEAAPGGTPYTFRLVDGATWHDGRPLTVDKEVRGAVAYVLDRALIAGTITKGPAIVGSAGVVPPEAPWFGPNPKQPKYDSAVARRLLGGQHLSIDLLADSAAREPALMAPMLAAVGITLHVTQVDAATWTQLLQDGNFQLALTSHIAVGCDPDYLRRWYVGEEANSIAQGSIFHDSACTAL